MGLRPTEGDEDAMEQWGGRHCPRLASLHRAQFLLRSLGDKLPLGDSARRLHFHTVVYLWDPVNHGLRARKPAMPSGNGNRP